MNFCLRAARRIVTRPGPSIRQRPGSAGHPCLAAALARRDCAFASTAAPLAASAYPLPLGGVERKARPSSSHRKHPAGADQHSQPQPRFLAGSDFFSARTVLEAPLSPAALTCSGGGVVALGATVGFSSLVPQQQGMIEPPDTVAL